MTSEKRTLPGFDTLSETAREILDRRAEALSREPATEVEGSQIELLCFTIGEEWYAVRIEDVREIYSEYRITPLPSLPAHLLGVINIRGVITSITDFRLLLGADPAEVGDAPVIVVGDDECETALLVDAIGDIVDVRQEDIEPPLSAVDQAHVDYVEGSIAIEDRLIALVALGKVIEPIGAE